MAQTLADTSRFLDEARGEASQQHATPMQGFVKLLRLRHSSGKRVPLPGPTYPLGGPLRPCNFGPTFESIPHLFAVLRR